MKLTKARHPTTAACSRTVKTRCSEMHTARSVISGGEPSALLESEVLTLNGREEVITGEGRDNKRLNWPS